MGSKRRRRRKTKKKAVKEKYLMKQILVGWLKIAGLAIHVSHFSYLIQALFIRT